VVWPAAGQYSIEAHNAFSTPIVEYVTDGAYDVGVLSTEIKSGRPTILAEPGHFIVATGIVDNTFTINDPGFNRSRLDDPAYQNTANSFRRYQVTSTNLSNLVITALSPTQLLVTDPLGNRTGFSLATSTILQNIPRSSYFFENALTDDTGQNPPPPAGAGTFSAIIRQPLGRV